MTTDSQVPQFDSASSENGAPSLDRFEGAIVFSAIGDALGWPTEFLAREPRRRPPFEYPVRRFVRWKKIVGGR
jgi:hypothetical protein